MIPLEQLSPFPLLYPLYLRALTDIGKLCLLEPWESGGAYLGPLKTEFDTARDHGPLTRALYFAVASRAFDVCTALCTCSEC